MLETEYSAWLETPGFQWAVIQVDFVIASTSLVGSPSAAEALTITIGNRGNYICSNRKVTRNRKREYLSQIHF